MFGTIGKIIKNLKTDVLVFLPDKPLEGSGSLSDWMGRAGDLSREAAPVCSHAQLSTHNKERSARGASIPNLPLVSLKMFPANFRYRVFYEATVDLK